jgi:hypothetical protein
MKRGNADKIEGKTKIIKDLMFFGKRAKKFRMGKWAWRISTALRCSATTEI